MKQVYYIISLYCLLLQYGQAQNTSYLYQRQTNESATNFVQRYMADTYNEHDLMHQVIEGYWGDVSKGKKIVAFTNLPLLDEYDKATMLIFQPLGDGKSYSVYLYNELHFPGVYYGGIASVFFADANADGHKELFILEAGEVRAATTITEKDENGNEITYETTACCEEVFSTSIVEQVYYDGQIFLPMFRYHEIPAHWDFDDLSTAGAVKVALRKFQQQNKN